MSAMSSAFWAEVRLFRGFGSVVEYRVTTTNPARHSPPLTKLLPSV